MYSPQELLTQLHEINLASVFNTEFTEVQHEAKIKVVKQKLRAIKQRVKAEQDDIKRKYDGRNSTENYLEGAALAPYNQLIDLIATLEVSLTDLDSRIVLHEQIPAPPVFGEAIIHTKSGYKILSKVDAARIEQEELANEAKRKADDYHALRQRIEALSSQVAGLDRAINEYPSSPNGTWSWVTLVVSGIAIVGIILYGLSPGQARELTTLALFPASIAIYVFIKYSVAKAYHINGLDSLYRKRRSALEQLDLHQLIFRPANNEFLYVRDKLERAKSLIDNKQYVEARQILNAINHPKAKEWLSKLNEMNV